MSDRSELMAKLLALPEYEREDIALRLLESLEETVSQAEWSTAWRKELARRWAEIEAGTAVLVDWRDAIADIRKSLETQSFQSPRT
jgi:putative addiction module component (TIGR02574 family)